MTTDRLAQLRDLLTEQGLDGALITDPANRFYLSGYSADGPPAEAGALIVGRDVATLLTSPNNTGWAEATVGPGIAVEAWERPWEPFVGRRLRDDRWRRVGFEDRALTVASHREILTEADGLALEPLGNAVDRFRAVKEAAELDLLAAAIRLNDEVFVAATAELRPGLTERELAWRIEREMRERGADGAAFPTIVAAGPHAARPHHECTDRPFEAGEPIIIDMGVRLRGYDADLTRTVWIGEPTPRLRAIYNVVFAAQAAALGALRAGLTGKEGDAVARDVIEAAGYGESFPHGLGHGLGIRIHEAPSLGKTSEDVLVPGQVVTVEPGIYVPDWGGVRIEDVGVVEAGGFRNLTTAPKPGPFSGSA